MAVQSMSKADHREHQRSLVGSPMNAAQEGSRAGGLTAAGVWWRDAVRQDKKGGQQGIFWPHKTPEEASRILEG